MPFRVHRHLCPLGYKVFVVESSQIEKLCASVHLSLYACCDESDRLKPGSLGPIFTIKTVR
jgi:hypothetical protein